MDELLLYEEDPLLLYDELAGRLYVVVLASDDVEIPDDVLYGVDVLLIVELPSPLRLLFTPVAADVALMLPVRFTLDICVEEPERVAIALEELRRTLDDAVLTFPVAVRLPTLLVREKPGLLCRPTVEAREP